MISLNRIAHHYDEPFGDSSAIPTGLVAKFASSKVKMVLTGDGGDESYLDILPTREKSFFSTISKMPRILKRGNTQFCIILYQVLLLGQFVTN